MKTIVKDLIKYWTKKDQPGQTYMTGWISLRITSLTFLTPQGIIQLNLTVHLPVTKGNEQIMDIANHDYFDLSSMDSYAKYRLLQEMEFQSITSESHNQQGEASLNILTQNVRGFKKTDIMSWLTSWRYMKESHRPHIFVLQETHINSSETASEYTKQWNRLWGIYNTCILEYWGW